MVIMPLNLCRICLESGAQLPLFENLDDENNDILKKLEFCLHETIADIDGYPRNICTDCKDMLGDIYRFITKFKDTCNILQNNLLVKLEQINYSEDDCNGQIEVEIKPENIKIESSDDELLSDLKKFDFKQPISESKPKLKTKARIRANKIKPLNKSNVTSTNKIASSILEGEFLWIGDTCIRPKKILLPVKREKPQPVAKQKRVQIKLPKVKIKKEMAPKLCDLCGMTFKRQDRLALHKRKVHFQKASKCPQCPQILCSDYYLNRHIKRCHQNEKTFICSTCERGFAFKGELSSHIRNVHNKHLKVKKQYPCKLCDKVFKCKKSVIVHERSAHTGYRPAVCTVCQTSFFHEDYLKEHMRLHTGETPFKCPICGRGYAQRGNMKSHLRIHRISETDANILSKLRPNYLKLLKP